MLGHPSVAAPEDPLPEVDADMRSFIDDMSMATYGKAPMFFEVHAHMGQYLSKQLQKRKGKISKKTTIVGTKFSHKCVLQAKYRKFGVLAKVGIAAKDLGIGRAGGSRRTRIGITNRFGKAKARANKVAYFSKKNKKSKISVWHWGCTNSHIWSGSSWVLPNNDKAAANYGG